MYILIGVFLTESDALLVFPCSTPSSISVASIFWASFPVPSSLIFASFLAFGLVVLSVTFLEDVGSSFYRAIFSTYSTLFSSSTGIIFSAYFLAFFSLGSF